MESANAWSSWSWTSLASMEVVSGAGVFAEPLWRRSTPQALLVTLLGLGLAAHVLVRAFQFVARVQHMRALTADIPGPTLGLVLKLWRARRSLHQVSDVFLEVLLNRRTPVFKFWSGPYLFVIIKDPDDVGFVLTNKTITEKSAMYRILASLMGCGLIDLGGDEWKRHRRIINPFMHNDLLRDFVQVFHRKAEVMLRCMEPHIDRGDTFNLHPFVSMAATDMVCETIMGTNMDAQRAGLEEREFSASIRMGLALITYRVLNPWFISDTLFKLSPYYDRFQRAMRALHGYTERLLATKRKEKGKERLLDRNPPRLRKVSKESPLAQEPSIVREEEGLDGQEEPGPEPPVSGVRLRKKRNSFLETMIDSPEAAPLNDAEIMDEAKSIITAATGGSTDVLCFTLLCIALRQDIQDKVVQELDRIYDGDEERVTTADDLRHMEYLDRVLKETLRMYPSIPLFARTVPVDMQLPSGYKVPAGAQLCLYTLAAHMDPRHFAEPQCFDPDRFLAENAAGRHQYAYLPFSVGPRSCFGQRYAVMQIKTAVSVVLRRYRLLPPAEGAPGARTIADIKTNMAITLSSRGGYNVRLRARRPHPRPQTGTPRPPGPPRPRTEWGSETRTPAAPAAASNNPCQ